MNTEKRKYLSLLEKIGTFNLRGSMRHPTPYMSKVHVLLHGVELRRRGENVPKDIKWPEATA
jgi:hypothetical protein